MAMRVSPEFGAVPPRRMIYEPVLVGFAMPNILMVTVEFAGMELLVHMVKVSVLYEVVAIVAYAPDPGQVDVAMSMPVEVTFASAVEVTLPNELVLGSKVSVIVEEAGVDDGVKKEILLVVTNPGRESLSVSLKLVTLAACTIWRARMPTVHASVPTTRPRVIATMISFLTVLY